MAERKFKVIKGGAAAAVSNYHRKFLSAFITDTRLMGVVGMYIHWELSNNDYITDFHQFFYFDSEEYDRDYKSSDNYDEIIMTEQALIGGLGGNKVR